MRFGGSPRHLLEAIKRGELAGFTSATAMFEVEEVLLRKFKLLPSEWILIGDVLREALVVVPTPVLPEATALRDKRDLHILAAADLCSADCIVSDDNDLLVLGQYNSIPIITGLA